MNRIAVILAAVTLVTIASYLPAREEGQTPASRPDREARDGREATSRPDSPRRDGRGDGEVKRPVVREFAKMAETCGLSDEQLQKIADLVAARNKAIVETQAKCQEEIMAVLTDEQKAKWQQAVVVTLLERRFAKVALTADQLDKIKAAVAEAAGKKALAVTDERSANEAAVKFSEFVTKEVLTDDQRAALQENGRDGRRDGETREPKRDGERKDGERK